MRCHWKIIIKLKTIILNFTIEDKVKVWKGGNDEDRFCITYSMRKASKG